jgi:hypothetical protein
MEANLDVAAADPATQVRSLAGVLRHGR